MTIIDAKAEWMESYTNTPNIKILFDEIPQPKDFIYEHKNGIYYAELDGHVSFFFYKKPDRGYGGRKFTLNMKEGPVKTLVGPWSSCSSQVNKHGFGPCTEASITSDPEVWERGFTFFAGSVTLDLAHEACRMCDTYLVKSHLGFWCPSLEPDRMVAWKDKGPNREIVKCVQNKMNWEPLNPAEIL